MIVMEVGDVEQGALCKTIVGTESSSVYTARIAMKASATDSAVS